MAKTGRRVTPGTGDATPENAPNRPVTGLGTGGPGNHPTPPRNRTTGLPDVIDAIMRDGMESNGGPDPFEKGPRTPAKRSRRTTGAKPGTRTPGGVTGRVVASPPALPFDPTRDTGEVWITSPRDGTRKGFAIHTQPITATFAPGQRVVSRLMENDYREGFGFADDFGVRVWNRLTVTGGAPACGKSGKSKHEFYADMLNRPSHYAAKGYVYTFNPSR